MMRQGTNANIRLTDKNDDLDDNKNDDQTYIDDSDANNYNDENPGKGKTCAGK